jgi:response regulator RpfG family c-di-GMP phosphodiesterase
MCARIVAIIDVYDALTTRIRYKRTFSHSEEREVIIAGKETQCLCGTGNIVGKFSYYLVK